MTTVFAPFGFRSVQPVDGIPGRLVARRNGIASGYNTDIAKGDPIIFLTDGTMTRAVAGDRIDGVFEKVDYTPTGAGNMRRTASQWPASQVASDIIAWFHPANDQHVFAVQASATLAATSQGDAADLIQGTTNPSSGWSRSYLGTLQGAAAQFKIVGLFETPDNNWGDAFPIVLVKINELGGASSTVHGTGFV